MGNGMSKVEAKTPDSPDSPDPKQIFDKIIINADQLQINLNNYTKDSDKENTYLKIMDCCKNIVDSLLDLLPCTRDNDITTLLQDSAGAFNLLYREMNFLQRVDSLKRYKDLYIEKILALLKKELTTLTSMFLQCVSEKLAETEEICNPCEYENSAAMAKPISTYKTRIRESFTPHCQKLNFPLDEQGKLLQVECKEFAIKSKAVSSEFWHNVK